MSDIRWTPDQVRAIDTDDRSLLVSAAAGSGKTAVLAARCARLVEGRPQPAEPAPQSLFDRVVVAAEACGVENLLVVTFTNAAARQMRDRIGRMLRNRLEELDAGSPPARRLRRELQLLPRADMSTLSSFCSRVLRRHFQAARIDPNFTVLDEDQARLLKQEAVRELFDEQYEDDAAEPFRRLIDLYGEGFDEGLQRRVIGCHELLTSVADPAEWKRRAVSRVEEAARKPLSQSELGRQWLAQLVEVFEGIKVLAEEAHAVARAVARGERSMAAVATWAQAMAMEASEWHVLARSGRLSELRDRVEHFNPPHKPPVRRSVAQKAEVDGAIKVARDAMKKQAGVAALQDEADWQRGMQRVIEPTWQFIDLVEVFEQRYAAKKAAIRALDFADLERKTLQLLLAPGSGTDPGRLTPSGIALDYQRRFHHVLVDEFQDINEVQDRLLRLLSRETAPAEGLGAAATKPNMFCVGDVKQSIYRFRLAEPEQFRQREKDIRGGRLAPAEVIPLATNFRSRAPLLGAINTAFTRLLSDGERLEIDYAAGHALGANDGYAPVPPSGFEGAPVEIHMLEPADAEQAPSTAESADSSAAAEEAQVEAERIEREAAFIAHRIRQLKAEGRMVLGESGEPEPFDLKHVAVLMRAMKNQSEMFARVLRRLGIPCHSQVGTGFFSSLEVRDILSLLHVLDNQRQDIPLAAVLRSPLVDLPRAEEMLARVRLAYPPHRMPFFQAVMRYANEQDDAVAARLRFVLAQLEEWRRLAHRRPLAELVWQVYIDSGYLAYVAGLHDGQQRVANLLELHRRAGQFDGFQRQGLAGFAAFLRTLEDAGEVGQPPVVGAGENVVQVMSVHGAKGLEFPVVFLADCGKGHNLTDSRAPILLDRQLGLALQAVDEEKQARYPTLIHELAKRRIHNASLAEELRILYVAMTRAKEHLICVGSPRLKGGQSVEAVLANWERFAQEQRLSPAEVLRAKSFLDWLGMAQAGTAGHFDVQIVRAPDILRMLHGEAGRHLPEPVDAALCNLQPLPEPPPMNAGAEVVIRRLMTSYAHEPVTRLRAAVAVTALKALQEQAAAPGAAAADGNGDGHQRPFAWRTRLAAPACVEEPAPGAADIGTATHNVLRLLDFTAASSAADVARQIERMVERHQLQAKLAGHVDIESLAWLAGTELGQRMARHQDRLLRELPVRVPADPRQVTPGWSAEAPGPLDRVMLRGQVDVVLPLESGLVLADYKTDRVSPEDAPAIGKLVDDYRPQVGHYCRAVEQIAGKRVSEAWLVLLHARRLERL